MVGPDTLDGKPMMVYQYALTFKVNDAGAESSSITKMWVGDDRLPYKLESDGSTNITGKTTTSHLVKIYSGYNTKFQDRSPDPVARLTSGNHHKHRCVVSLFILYMETLVMSRHNRLFALLLLCAAVLVSVGAAPAPQSVSATNDSRTEGDSRVATLATPHESLAAAPDTFVANGVSNFTLAAPKIFWYDAPYCPSPPKISRQPSLLSSEDPAVINRVATYGSQTRQIFNRNDPRPDGTCNPYYIASNNIIADKQFVYWVDASGLVRLPADANVGDLPVLLASAITGYSQLAQDSTFVYAMTANGAVWRVAKTGGNADRIATSQGGPTESQLASDGLNVYWIGNGNLWAVDPDPYTERPDPYIITGNVTAFYALAQCSGCSPAYDVYIAHGNRVDRYNNVTGTTTLIYQSSIGQAWISNVTGDSANLFILETHPIGSFPKMLIRTPRDSFSNGEVLYFSSNSLPPEHLATDGTFLFWQEAGGLMRLPNNADALLRINVRATGMEVTQGIQNTTNTVLLVQNRRTFVRVFVQSDGAAVPGVTATLSGSWSGGSGNAGLLPAGPNAITAQSSPNRNNINDSFLFELPWEWATKTNLVLEASVNPYGFPLEPTYDDNQKSVGPLTFKASPRLEVQFVEFGYALNNRLYYPRLVEDLLGNYSWIRRVYPLASTAGNMFDPSPGFRPNVWLVGDDGLGSRVDQTAPECAKLLKKNADGTTTDDRNLCASAYTNSLLKALRTENALSATTFMYGMIFDPPPASPGATNYFPRGQEGGDRVSSGPAGTGWEGFYAGHEIGHSLGRGHPATGNGECGLNGGDPSPSYPHAHIGPDDGSVNGFDVGDPELKVQRRVLPGNNWFDMMAYCQPNWVSDKNYENIYQSMGGSSIASIVSTAQADGDWLSLFGAIAPDGSTATVHRLRRLSSVVNLPPRQPGAYSIQLLGAQNQVLADYPFTPTATDDGVGWLGFGQVVPFVSGARQARIVKIAAGQVLASENISANVPTLSGVALQNAPNPVSGTATLLWNASDPDGDTLRFDVLYSRNNGASFQPLKMNVVGNSTQLDTAQLGGGVAILRVIVSDGVQTTQADSAPFAMANKPPQPRILTPGDGTTIHSGQLVNFSGEADDLQDGSISGASLIWSNQKGVLGSGSLLSVDDLPVGSNQITLAVINSAGLTANKTITVIVDDDLNLPGPTLSVGPVEVSWQVAAGATQLQSAQVSLSNIGSGGFTWAAASSVPWLTLSPATGGVPAILSLTANPSGMANGSTAIANVEIATDNGQRISIPVRLFVGNVRDSDSGLGDLQNQVIYLPIVHR